MKKTATVAVYSTHHPPSTQHLLNTLVESFCAGYLSLDPCNHLQVGKCQTPPSMFSAHKETHPFDLGSRNDLWLHVLAFDQCPPFRHQSPTYANFHQAASFRPSSSFLYLPSTRLGLCGATHRVRCTSLQFIPYSGGCSANSNIESLRVAETVSFIY